VSLGRGQVPLVLTRRPSPQGIANNAVTCNNTWQETQVSKESKAKGRTEDQSRPLAKCVYMDVTAK
jgi:hypothetical protein